MDYLLTTQWISTCYLTGLIWFVQWVHYPIYSLVSPADRQANQAFHIRRTTAIVFLPMVVELFGGTLLVFREWDTERFIPALMGMGLLGVIWLSTLVLQIPRHGKIGHPKTDLADASSIEEENYSIRMLVKTNWIRTLSWSGRLAILAIYFPQS